jgi:hypothetical protein
MSLEKDLRQVVRFYPTVSPWFFVANQGEKPRKEEENG